MSVTAESRQPKDYLIEFLRIYPAATDYWDGIS